MAEFLQISFLATVVQAGGTVLVAGLLLPVSRAMPGPHLRLWAAAWGCQAAGARGVLPGPHGPAGAAAAAPVAVPAGRLPVRLPGVGRLPPAGLRPRTSGPATGWCWSPRPLSRSPPRSATDGRVWRLFPVHAATLSGLFLMSLLEARRIPGRLSGPAVGRWVVRLALMALVVLFAHYTVVVGFVAGGGTAGLEYLAFASLYDVLLQTALAFGMVILAADHTRELLEDRNRALAAAAAELAGMARTDPLTGPVQPPGVRAGGGRPRRPAAAGGGGRPRRERPEAAERRIRAPRPGTRRCNWWPAPCGVGSG